jgi:acyl carrier protein
VVPGSPAEEVVAAIWRDMLGVAELGVDDDFFALGGHSLLAHRVLNRIQEAFRVELPLRSLFERPTVAGVVAALAQALGDPALVQDVARLYQQLEGLTDEAAAALLAGDGAEYA